MTPGADQSLRGLLLATLIIASPWGAAAASKSQDADAEEASSPIAAAEVTGSAAGSIATFEERRQLCFEAVWNDFEAHQKKLSAKNAFWRAEVLFEMGKVPEGHAVANRGLDQLVPGNRENRWIYGGNSGFTAWPGMDCYVRYNQFFDAALKDRFKKIYTGAVFYKRLTTSNHTIMAAVTRYLATQIWGPDAFAPDPYFVHHPATDGTAQTGAGASAEPQPGTYFTKDDPTGVKFCRMRIASAMAIGPGEYASRPYGAEDILPLLTLAECAGDADIRRTALAAYQNCLAELAPAYLRGHLATFSTRSYPDVLTQQPWGVAALAWMYFGGVEPGAPEQQWGLRAMTSTYRVPADILAAGTDRTRAYTFRSLVNGWALTTYMSQTYALFSRSPKARHPKVLGQNYPCGVMWDEPDSQKASFLWITNPAADEATPHSRNNPNGIHTHGVTLSEQQVQLSNAMLSVYHIAPDYRNPYVLGFVPGGYKAMINDASSSGRIYLGYGSVLITLSASQPFEWNPASGVRAPAARIPLGGSEFRIMAPDCAVAIETAEPGDFPGNTPDAQLAAFREHIVAKASIHCEQSAGAPKGSYTDRDGNVITCIFNGNDTINGKMIDYSRWPVLECPWYSHPPLSRHS